MATPAERTTPPLCEWISVRKEDLCKSKFISRERENTISRMWISPSRVISWWFLPACPVRVNPRWRSIPFTPRASAVMSSRCPPMRVSSSDRWKNPMWTTSTVCPRLSRSTKKPPPRTRARRWARSPRFTTTCVCCGRESVHRTVPSAARRFTSRPLTRSLTS